MYRRLLFILLFTVSFINISTGQALKRKLEAGRLIAEPEIDGLANDEVWQIAKNYGDFVQYEPYNGSKPKQKTEIRFGYTDNAFFVIAELFDSHPDSIIKGLTKRDDVSNSHTDAFAVSIDPFNDGIYAFVFRVSVLGVQEDVRISPDDEDDEWDAVWISKTSVNENGWVVEMKIPFSAIRLPKDNNQVWGVNAWRYIRRNREWSTLNFVDQTKHGVINQSATLYGLKDINPPLRLSLFPYVSTYLEKHPGQQALAYSLNYGADLKYGINESFTLDLTLIPDFGQVKSDDEILNLSPFEVKYNENRQFFTESTELFNKGGIFYTRRIGGRPVDYYRVGQELRMGEEIVSNPNETQLINAAKLSGRSRNGLGIGVLNAMTSATKALIMDSLGNERIIQTQGFTNYNVFVLDQTLKNNSFISLINTNVKRLNYMADVSAIELSLLNKTKTYGFGGKFLLSQRYIPSNHADLGYSYAIGVSKTSGNFRFSLSQAIESDTYNPNDLGFLQANNSVFHYLSLKYNIYKPFWKVHFWHNEFSISHTMLYKPNEFTDFSLYYTSRTRFRNHLSAGLNLRGTPFRSYDFYEPRIWGMKYAKMPYIGMDLWISPDYRKTLAVDLNTSYRHTWVYNMNYYSIRLGPRWRINDQFMLIYTGSYSILYNDRGFAILVDDSIGGFVSVFGRRNMQTVTNTFNIDFIFNPKSSLSFRLRHYWSEVDYFEYYQLQQNGSLQPDNYSSNHDLSFNSFNIDIQYTWQFAPGSELSLVWKNAIYTNGNQVQNSYLNNLENILNAEGTNSLSFKILYYLDYNYIKNRSCM